MPVSPATDVVGSEFEPLLAEPFAQAWQATAAQLTGARAARRRLQERAMASRASEAQMITARRRRVAHEILGTGVQSQTLYVAQGGRPLRPGEPLRVRLIELAAGARLTPALLATPAQTRHLEWLVLAGSVEHGGQVLGPRDYQVSPAGHVPTDWTSAGGALLFLRESEQPAVPGDRPVTVLDAEAGWPDFGPGIQRRVLWQRDGQAALLYYAEAGAQVPKHRHGHDEECLMVQGELFLDDLLLQPGDYQLAPAGTGHRITETDTGVVIYAHGDLDLQFVA